MKQNLNTMKKLHITNDIYSEMKIRAERYFNAFWDSIELTNGCAVTFAIRDGQPYDVEAFDSEDNDLIHDFSLTTFNAIA